MLTARTAPHHTSRPPSAVVDTPFDLETRRIGVFLFKRQCRISRNKIAIVGGKALLSIKKASYVLFCLLWCSLLPAECPPLNDAKTQEIISYAAKLWQIGEASQLNLISNGTLGTTCYRNLTLDGGSIKHPMTLILSPDQRFISGWLIDLTRTPEDAQRDEMDRMKRLLTRDVSPHKGDPSSPVTIVEFADFECPYCKAFDHSFSSLPENMRQAVNLVFKHLPLANHPWAREVAGAAACAGL